nr:MULTISPECIES: hypothetical protein [Amycolatopsis]
MTEYLSADRVLNTTAAGTPATRLQVRALRRIQDAVLRTVEELRESDTSAQASHAAQALDVLLGACLDTEPSVLPPARCRRPVLVNDLRTLLDGGELDRAEVLDVPSIPHGTRHPRIRPLRAARPRGIVRARQQPRSEAAAPRVHRRARRGFHLEVRGIRAEKWRARIGRAAVPA